MKPWNWIDRTNMRWGKLTAIKYLGNKQWLCKCDCGNEKIVSADNLPISSKRKATTSCGCNLKSRKVKNINYFEKIDTEAKAYYLGLIATDGTIYIKNNNYSLKIVLTKNDYDILEKFKKELDSNVTIKFFNATSTLPQGGFCNSDFCSFLVCSKDIVQDLGQYGIIPRKSNVLKFNYDLLPNDFLKDFLRGVWDGDGTFSYLEKRSLIELSLTTNYEMAVLTKNKILEIFPDFHIGIYPTKKNTNTVRMIFTRQKESEQFLDYLYSSDTVFKLKRKYDKYINIKSLLH